MKGLGQNGDYRGEQDLIGLKRFSPAKYHIEFSMATLLKFHTAVLFRFSVICVCWQKRGQHLSASWYSDQVREYRTFTLLLLARGWI